MDKAPLSVFFSEHLSFFQHVCWPLHVTWIWQIGSQSHKQPYFLSLHPYLLLFQAFLHMMTRVCLHLISFLTSHPSPIIITRQHHVCYSHAPGSQCGFLSELPSAKEILCVECDPRVHVNHPHRQLQLYGGRNLQKHKGSALTPARSWASWMQSKSGIMFVMAVRMRSPAVIECFCFHLSF